MPGDRLIAYALPALPLALLGLPVAIYLPAAYAADHGLPLALVGGVLLVARIWDMIADPLVGACNDRITTRFGRRRVAMVAGLPLLLVAADQLLRPSGTPSALDLLLWSLLLYSGWSLVAVPYLAWGAELAEGAAERTRIAATREAFVIGGTLLAALVAGDAALARIAEWLWWLLPPAVAIACLRVGEPTSRRERARSVGGWRLLRRNRLLRRLLAAFLINGVANAIPATLFLLYVEHALSRPELMPAFLAAYLLAGLPGFLLWLPLARRFGRARAWAGALAFAALVFLCVPLVPPGGTAGFLVICLLSGLSLGVDMALPASMQADALDADRAAGGGERAGLLFGLWGMATKLALALGVGIAFPFVEWGGFAVDAAGVASGTTALVLGYGLLPVLFKLIAAALAWRLPIDLNRHPEVRDATANPAAARSAAVRVFQRGH